MIDQLKTLISKTRFTFNDEGELQEQFEDMLQRAGIWYVREMPLNGMRVDFLVEVGDHKLAAVELKVKGGEECHLRQLASYALDPKADVVVLVRPKLMNMPKKINDKPSFCIPIAFQSL